MLKHISRTWLVVSLWLTTLAVIVASTMAMGAALSTIVALLVLGLTPLLVMLLLGGQAAPPTVAEILHTVNARDDRGSR
ncbi:MAG: hypothetical protein KGN76_04410 [Acidobacteriota bacterium]|nr:hypothetical protein [Acidobacteriota bacterium]